MPVGDPYVVRPHPGPAIDGVRGVGAHQLIERAEGRALAAVTTQRTSVRRWTSPADVEVVRASFCDPVIGFHTGDTLVVDGGSTVF
jgi:hypothetical protein